MDFADFVKPSEGAPIPGASSDSPKPNASAKKPLDFSSFLEQPEEPKAVASALTQYDTKLNPQEETQFQAWKSKYAPRDSGADYDLRGAFKAGLRPDSKSGHWPDTFKKPNHPTFSDQSRYAKDRPELAGRWEGNKYIPPKKKQADQEEENPVVIGEGVPPEAHESLKSVAQEAAAVADLPLGIPAMVAKGLGFTGGVIGEGAGALKTGTPTTRKDLLKAGAKTGEEFAAPLADPAKRLLRYLGYGEDVDETAVSHAAGVFSQWMKKGNKFVEQKTGGMINEEEADQIENAILAGGPVELYKAVKGRLPKGAEPAAARVEPGPLPPQEFTPEHQARLTELERAASTKPKYKMGPEGKPQRIHSGRVLSIPERMELDKLRAAKEASSPAVADDFIKRMDKESAELAKEAEPEAKSEESKADRPFADTKKWDTPRLERLATAAEKRIEESKTKFEESKATDRRRRMKSLATEEHAEGTKRLEDELKQLQEELGARKSNKTAAAAIAAGVGVGAAVTAVIATNPDVKDKAGTAAIAAAALFGFPRESIGALYKAADSGGRVLERLAERAPEKSVYKKAEIVSEMNRQDIPKAEQDIIRGLLGKPGDTISAEELVQGFKLATQNFELKPVKTEKYNDVGIEYIRPPETFFTEEQEAHTTVWKLPESWNIPARGHFEELGPNQYGHTRSFEEDGVRHVVELQSDLLQSQKELSGEERKSLEHALKATRSGMAGAAAALKTAKLPETIKQITEEQNRRILRVNELEAKLSGGKIEGLDSVAKQWPRRLIQEELAQAGREGLKKIRFASADTVALVEQWPDAARKRSAIIRNLEKDVRDYEAWSTDSHYDTAHQTKYRRAKQEALEEIERLKKISGRFSPRDQPIYDRYKGEITKYLKSLGAKDYTDPHGHTWLELPTKPGVPPRQFGKADPKLIAGVGIGAAVGAYAASDDHKVGGAAAGALGGALLVGMFASKMFAKAEGGIPARELAAGLARLVGRQVAKQIELLKFAASIPRDYRQHAEQIYHSLEDPTIKLSPRAAELKFKYVNPIMRQNALLRESLKKLGVDIGEDVDAYVHRIVKGKPSIFEQFARTAPQGRTFSQFAPPLEDRTVFKLTDPETGDAMYGVKDETGQGYKAYKNRKIVGSGKISPKIWKEGNVPFGGKTLKRSQATTKELEEHTPLEYHHDALASAIASNARLTKVRNNNVFLKDLLKSPGASEIALKRDAPPDWRAVPQIPQLHGYKFAPRIANVLEDFAGAPGSDLVEGIANVSRVMTGSLFWNPLPHIFNVLDHSIIQRGLVSGWLNPAAYPRLIRTTLKASKAVTEQNADYLRFVKEGAGLMYPNVLLSDFSRKVLDRLGQQPEMGTVAKAWGYVSPAEMVRRIYSFSRKSLWAVNDILMMQAYLEKEMVKPEVAIADVEKHIPNYRVPDVVLGSRMLSQALQSPIFTAFGRYDYGRMRSYGEMVKGVIGKDRTIKDRAKALDQIAMLTVMGAAVYPLLMDNAAKAITGNPNAEATRFGASGIPYLVYSYLHGKKQFSQVLQSSFPTGMAAKAGIELATNRDLYAGRHLIEEPKDIGDYLAKQISPLGTAARIESGQLTPGQFAASAVGIRSPMTTAQKKDLAAKRLREKTRKRVDQLLGR